MTQPAPMNAIKVCDGGTVWWHVTRGNMGGEFVTVADYLPDEATARLIAAAPKLLEAARRGANACDMLAAEAEVAGELIAAELWRMKESRCREAIADAEGRAS